MTVLISKHRRAIFVKKWIQQFPNIYVFSGTMPADVNALTKANILANYSASLLVEYQGVTMTEDTDNFGWKMSVSNDAVNADVTGTAGWFLCSKTYSSYGDYDYAVSDSISLPGAGGILQLASLGFTAGQAAPAVTDFRFSIA